MKQSHFTIKHRKNSIYLQSVLMRVH